MAGSNDDSPVPLNVTAMIDVIFCLCVFFMCSFHFKAEQGKFQAWLPQDRGDTTTAALDPYEVRVALSVDPGSVRAVRTLGLRRVESDEELAGLLRDARRDAERLRRPDLPMIIDSAPDVCWDDVVRVLDIGKQAEFAHVEFAASARGR